MVVCLVVIMTILLGDKLDKFLAILGSVTCTPMAFTFPALFHLKACAETPKQKFIDIFILVLSIIIFFYCTFKGLQDWAAAENHPIIDYNAVHEKTDPTPTVSDLPDL